MHALLSASGSKRWLSCPPSAKLEEQFPEKKSAYAAEGTFAHYVAEQLLLKALGMTSEENFKNIMDGIQVHHFYSTELADYVQIYVDLTIEKINEAWARTKSAVILFEQKLDYSPWTAPNSFGTGDVVIITDSIIEIVDLKYGRGVPVEAKGNTQMRLYALGANNDFGYLFGIETVRMTVCQPRLDAITTDEIPIAELLTWGNDVVKPSAQLAINGEGNFYAGEHCRFCRAKATCRARAEANLELAKHDFPDPFLLPDKEN